MASLAGAAVFVGGGSSSVGLARFLGPEVRKFGECVECAANGVGSEEDGALAFNELDALNRKRIDGAPVLDWAAAVS